MSRRYCVGEMFSREAQTQVRERAGRPPRLGLQARLEATMARGRSVGVTQRHARSIARDGGLLAVPDALTKQRIENLGSSLMFGIQLAPPALGAICASARIHLDANEMSRRQLALHELMTLTRTLFRADSTLAERALELDGDPTPIRYIVLGNVDTTIAATDRLLRRGFLVNPVAFPAVALHQSGIRATLTVAHTPADVHALLSAITEVISSEPRA